MDLKVPCQASSLCASRQQKQTGCRRPCWTNYRDPSQLQVVRTLSPSWVGSTLAGQGKEGKRAVAAETQSEIQLLLFL